MTGDLIPSSPLPVCRAYAPTDVIIQEMQYAADILKRAEEAISREFSILRAGGVVIDWGVTQRLSWQLTAMRMDLSILALQALEARAA